MDQIVDNVRTFILANYLQGESPENVPDDMPLRSSGILNSLAILAVITFIEKEYGIEVEAHETDVDNFDRLRDIAAFVARKRAA